MTAFYVFRVTQDVVRDGARGESVEIRWTHVLERDAADADAAIDAALAELGPCLAAAVPRSQVTSRLVEEEVQRSTSPAALPSPPVV